MGRKALVITGGLIAAYLAAAYATGFGKLMLNAGTAGSGVIKTLQGR